MMVKIWSSFEMNCSIVLVKKSRLFFDRSRLYFYRSGLILDKTYTDVEFFAASAFLFFTNFGSGESSLFEKVSFMSNSPFVYLM